MDKVNTEAALQEAILLLEMRQAEEAKLIKEEFHDTYERLKPANIVKNMFRKKITSPGLTVNVMGKTVDIALVVLTNVILRKKTNSFIKRAIGTALVFGIKNVLSRNPQIGRAAGAGITKIISRIITKRNKNREYTYSSRM